MYLNENQYEGGLQYLFTWFDGGLTRAITDPDSADWSDVIDWLEEKYGEPVAWGDNWNKGGWSYTWSGDNYMIQTCDKEIGEAVKANFELDIQGSLV
jgi:hypothetical protein